MARLSTPSSAPWGCNGWRQERNVETPADRRMEWRIGVHVGDVLVEGDDILGDGVNIAARLESIAEPGGICISDDAFRQVRGKVEELGLTIPPSILDLADEVIE